MDAVETVKDAIRGGAAGRHAEAIDSELEAVEERLAQTRARGGAFARVSLSPEVERLLSMVRARRARRAVEPAGSAI